MISRAPKSVVATRNEAVAVRGSNATPPSARSRSRAAASIAPCPSVLRAASREHGLPKRAARVNGVHGQGDQLSRQDIESPT
jgi:hypothetical protein